MELPRVCMLTGGIGQQVSSSFGLYPWINIQKTMEHDPVEIVDLPIENGDFLIVM